VAQVNRKQIESFTNPGNEFRGAPFWAWNGKLEPQELRRQIQVMHRMGLGGFFMHSRVGLDTPYLSKEWFDCVNACVDEAKKLKMNAWLYDEDRWPSGAAGGLVTKNPKYRMRSLAGKVLDTADGFRWTPATQGAFVARVDGLVARDIRPVPRGKRPPKLAEGEKLVVFAVELWGCSNWFNGYTYLDTMNHEAVRQFIKVTHEAYRKNCCAKTRTPSTSSSATRARTSGRRPSMNTPGAWCAIGRWRSATFASAGLPGARARLRN